MIEVRTFAGREAAAEALAESVGATLEAAVAERGEARLVVSGGSTPQTLFSRLRTRPLPWEAVRVTLADERWVPAEHPESNEGMVRESLLQGPAAAASFKGLKTPAEDPASGLAACEALVAELRPFDVVLLGMGGDGHFASLFPDDPRLAEGLDLQSPRSCHPVAPAGSRLARMSLTLPALLDSRRVVLYFMGEEKWRIYQRATGGGAERDLPVRALLRAVPRTLEVWWAP